MRFSTIFFFEWLLVMLSFSGRSHAQTIEKDSLINAKGYAEAVQVYHTSMVPETRFYRGAQYVDYLYTINEGHPFFLESHPQKGSLLYDGVFYRDVDLLYDLVKEQVVIDDPWRIYKISLLNQRLDWFYIGSHFFVNLRDTVNRSAPRAGFYEQLYHGRIVLYKKEKKQILQDLTSGAMRKLIIRTTSYYLKKGMTYYAVDNKRLLVNALGDKGAGVRKFIRKNGLNMRKDPENTLMSVSAWYDKNADNPVSP